MKKVNLIFPQKEDYPEILRVLSQSKTSSKYRELVESSASAYFETNFLTRYLFRQRFIKAVKLIGKDKTDLLTLDAGCGIGFFLFQLSQISKKVWAIDYAKHSLDYAKFMCQKRGLKNISFAQIDLVKGLPFKKDQFDLIVCLSVLEHIKDLQAVIAEFDRVLKKDGVLIAGYPNEDNFIFRIFQYVEKRLFRPKVYKTFKGTKLIHLSRAHQIDQTLRKFFKPERTENITLLPGIDLYIVRRWRKIF